MRKTINAVALAVGFLTSAAAVGQVPSVVSPGFALDTVESIDTIFDLGAASPDGSVGKKVYTVPAGRAFRLTDLSVDPRNANTSANPCFFELWRGTEAGPTQRAWSRVRIFGSSTYDRSWITGPQFGPGEVVWIIARFDPFNAGLRICTRTDPNIATELRYALRGYLVRAQ